ncbi:MAG: type II toxin-antitoxin system YoeB family toxin [Nitrospira sp. CG24E]|nr:MAG: type II toxin-antitoxin system YoeB family toxin [Nitrospira sp. CG24E]
MKWQVGLTSHARVLLEAIQDRRVRDKIRDRIDGLAEEPEKQGKPLTGELTGYRSLRAVGQRYRIIYRIEEAKVVVLVMALGLRKEGSGKDIYMLAQKLLRLRLL